MTIGKAFSQIMGAVYFSTTASNMRVRIDKLKKIKIQLPRPFDHSNEQQHLKQRQARVQHPSNHYCFTPEIHRTPSCNYRFY